MSSVSFTVRSSVLLHFYRSPMITDVDFRQVVKSKELPVGDSDDELSSEEEPQKKSKTKKKVVDDESD